MAGRRVLVLIGSETDLVKVEAAITVLSQHGIETELRVAGPPHAGACRRAGDDGADRASAIIAAAGWPCAARRRRRAHHGASPCRSPPERSVMDALLACVQMPPGIPVATVGIDSARNAGLLAVQILALGEPALAAKLSKGRRAMIRAIEESDGRIGGGKR